MKRGTIGFTLIAALGTLAGCDEALYLGNDPSKLVGAGESENSPGGSAVEATSLSLDGCVQSGPNHYPVSGACAFDSNAKTYLQEGTPIELTNISPFGVAFRFAPGYTPAASDLSVNTFDASIEVYASSDYSEGPSFGGKSTYVRVSTVLRTDGALVLTVLDPIPDGFYVSVDLHMGALYRSRISPSDGGKCSMPDSFYCTEGDHAGYRARFAVRGAPAGAIITKPKPDDSCLLSYNSALVPSGGDLCCFRQGQDNQCNTGIQCNDLSGAGCCLIYGTESTAGGERCCLYENGQLGDGADECKGLLNSALPVSGPTDPEESTCLLSYNSALVASDADVCCFRKGESNLCDESIQCNARSGGSCCLIYATANTSQGARCCLYEDGSLGDGAAECQTLLETP